jgi:hypothetical protein
LRSAISSAERDSDATSPWWPDSTSSIGPIVSVSGVRNSCETLRSAVRFVQFAQLARLVLDRAERTLREIARGLGLDARDFRFVLLADEVTRACFDLRGQLALAHEEPALAPPHGLASAEEREREERAEEPPRLPEVRSDADRHAGDRPVPVAVRQARGHFERVLAGRDVREVRGAAVAGVRPFARARQQPVAKAQVARRAQRQARVRNRELAFRRPEVRDVREARDAAVLGGELLDHRRRRRHPDAGDARIHDDRPLLRREPQPAIACADARALRAAVRLAIGHAVVLGEGVAEDARRPARRERVERRARHAKQAHVRAAPQRARVVGEQRVDDVGIEAVAGAHVLHARLLRGTALGEFDARDPLSFRRDPNDAAIVLEQPAHRGRRESLLLSETLEAAVSPDGDAAALGAEPQFAVRALDARAHPRASETVVGVVALPEAVLRAPESLLRADPERALPVLVDQPDVVEAAEMLRRERLHVAAIHEPEPAVERAREYAPVAQPPHAEREGLREQRWLRRADLAATPGTRAEAVGREIHCSLVAFLQRIDVERLAVVLRHDRFEDRGREAEQPFGARAEPHAAFTVHEHAGGFRTPLVDHVVALEELVHERAPDVAARVRHPGRGQLRAQLAVGPG